jgi:hypothetical protein
MLPRVVSKGWQGDAWSRCVMVALAVDTGLPWASRTCTSMGVGVLTSQMGGQALLSAMARAMHP